ncbi:hypothetical protein OF364_02335 [Mycoplasma enhydrae]|uniref:hypothetical protein n=1 Tax=Mycoplasma enhydrae TaxID=2499220 RepID=UPI00197B1166|nr:hypothetical protein [Mycoplasma enhydrae]MBN4089323.1 hypothetical protein [Mycoplasma enhydrae]MCV3733695.1 hypothetical protein [Mycoplasma enhydrae]MCV3753648.1 hypothetical protein [Mycoplasma enhydrae]
MEYTVGKIIKAKVQRVSKNVITLLTKDAIKCFLSINEVSDYYINDLKMMFKVDDIKELLILEIMPNKSLVVSYKQIHPKELRNPFKFKLDTKNTNFDALLEFTNKGIDYGD